MDLPLQSCQLVAQALSHLDQVVPIDPDPGMLHARQHLDQRHLHLVVQLGSAERLQFGPQPPFGEARHHHRPPTGRIEVEPAAEVQGSLGRALFHLAVRGDQLDSQIAIGELGEAVAARRGVEHVAGHRRVHRQPGELHPAIEQLPHQVLGVVQHLGMARISECRAELVQLLPTHQRRLVFADGDHQPHQLASVPHRLQHQRSAGGDLVGGPGARDHLERHLRT